MSIRSGSLSGSRAQEIYEQSIVIDGLIQPTMSEAQLARMKASAVTAFHWTVCSQWAELGVALTQIVDALQFASVHGAEVDVVRCAADIEKAKPRGKIGLVFGMQSPKPAESDPRLFAVLHNLGVRVIQLTHNDRNLYGDGVTEPGNAGLSVAGRRAIGEMNRLGILIDLSHSADRTTREAIDASARPVAVTHANCQTVFPNPRNKTDDALKALAARGGVVGLSLWSPMVGSQDGGWPTVDDYLRHVDHVASLIGPEHVAIGTDHSEDADREVWERNFSRGGRYSLVTGNLGEWYRYETRNVQEANSCLHLPAIAGALARLGFSEAELRGILGGNLLRLFGQVWAA